MGTKLQMFYAYALTVSSTFETIWPALNSGGSQNNTAFRVPPEAVAPTNSWEPRSVIISMYKQCFP